MHKQIDQIERETAETSAKRTVRQIDGAMTAMTCAHGRMATNIPDHRNDSGRAAGKLTEDEAHPMTA